VIRVLSWFSSSPRVSRRNLASLALISSPSARRGAAGDPGGGGDPAGAGRRLPDWYRPDLAASLRVLANALDSLCQWAAQQRLKLRVMRRTSVTSQRKLRWSPRTPGDLRHDDQSWIVASIVSRRAGREFSYLACGPGIHAHVRGPFDGSVLHLAYVLLGSSPVTGDTCAWWFGWVLRALV
jgi:hypothetical protein